MKILIDMNLSPAWVQPLQAAGYEAAHWSELGSAAATDQEIVDRARADGYVLFTQDLDFSAILAVGGNSWPSVVQLRTGDLRPKAMMAKVLAALALGAEDLRRGAVLTIGSSRMRIRMLPLSSDGDEP